jgi:DNA ligase-1
VPRTTRFTELTLERQNSLYMVWSEVVVEIALDIINRSHRHTSEFALRFPRIKRIRTDKTVHEIDDVEKVQTLFQRSMSSSPTS